MPAARRDAGEMPAARRDAGEAPPRGIFGAVLRFFGTGPDRPPFSADRAVVGRVYERKRWSVFLSVTFGYGLFYVCRINFAVAKGPLLDEKILDTAEMGIIGSALLLVYALGRLTNGFLADRSNIRRFMATGLLVSAAINLLLGSAALFAAFLVLWGLNGWFQSMGSAPSVVALSHWFSNRERGTRYGVWSVSHAIGEGLTFAVTSVVVVELGWRWGFWGPGLLGAAAALILYRTLADRPQTYGLPHVADYRDDHTGGYGVKGPVRGLQLAVLRRPAIWILGLASAAMYMARYGMLSWGVVYLTEGKGYDPISAGAVLSAFPIASLAGAATSGFVSDRFFASRRNVPVLLYGLGEIAALAAFFLVPSGHPTLASAIMVLFGFSLGGLLVFLGGLMAVDIVSQRAAGAAMGVIGLFSYVGAAAQDLASGLLLQANRIQVGDRIWYDFDPLRWFWIGASVLSLVLTLTLWNVKADSRPARE